MDEPKDIPPVVITLRLEAPSAPEHYGNDQLHIDMENVTDWDKVVVALHTAWKACDEQRILPSVHLNINIQGEEESHG